jgi:hypothetical protein
MLALASDFLAFSVLTLLLPVCLLIAIAIWHTGVARNVAQRGIPRAQPPGTPPPVTDEELPKL